MPVFDQKKVENCLIRSRWVKDFLKGSGSKVKDQIRQSGAAAGTSFGGSDFTGVTIPLTGIGVNFGGWYAIPETCELVSWSGCKACDE